MYNTKEILYYLNKLGYINENKTISFILVPNNNEFISEATSLLYNLNNIELMMFNLKINDNLQLYKYRPINMINNSTLEIKNNITETIKLYTELHNNTGSIIIGNDKFIYVLLYLDRSI